jgi:hypothetical protein
MLKGSAFSENSLKIDAFSENSLKSGPNLLHPSAREPTSGVAGGGAVCSVWVSPGDNPKRRKKTIRDVPMFG